MLGQSQSYCATHIQRRCSISLFTLAHSTSRKRVDRPSDSRRTINQQYLLLLEEKEVQSFSISALESLGLTKREAEVLFWTAKDKSNAGIAKVLGCSEGTVRKHLEHLYGKLSVQTRTAAVMVALEKLGLVNG